MPMYPVENILQDNNSRIWEPLQCTQQSASSGGRTESGFWRTPAAISHDHFEWRKFFRLTGVK
jgi:hypothetical protein